MHLLIILGLVTPYFLEEQRPAWPWLPHNVNQVPGRAFTKLMGKYARNKSLNQINEMLTCHEQSCSLTDFRKRWREPPGWCSDAADPHAPDAQDG